MWYNSSATDLFRKAARQFVRSDVAVIHSNLSELNADSVVADLPASDFSVTPDVFGRVVAHEFQHQPELPGVLICDGAMLLGMICAKSFLST